MSRDDRYDGYGFMDSSGDESDGTNRQYKDRLFKAIFGSPERKNLTLELYNAVNGSAYTNEEDIELTTIDNVVYMGMRNDVSFLFDQVMNLWEQQSTPNPNMPLRFLLYYAHVMERHVKRLGPRAGGIYSSALVQLPTPRMILFYNGSGTMPEYLHLSDAYVNNGDPDVQVRVRVINIHSGQSHVLELCRPLQDYTTFVEAFQRYHELGRISDRAAASRAIAELPPGAVRDYLEAHEAEVVDMLLTEYDEEKTLQAERYVGERIGLEKGIKIGEDRGLQLGREEGLQAGREEGLQAGLELGRLNSLYELVADGDLPIDRAVAKASALGIADEADFRKRAAEQGIRLPE